MPSVSKAQQAVASLAKQVKDGKTRLADVPVGMRDDVKSMTNMSAKQLDDFASTPTKGLPKHAKPPQRKKRT